MAELYHYKCTECDFDIMSTPWGGDVFGLGYGYYLYCCQECKHLSEIEHGFTDYARKEIEEKEAFIDHFIKSSSGEPRNNLKKCSHCGSTKLSRWKPEDGKCPHCGGRIIRLNDRIMYTD